MATIEERIASHPVAEAAAAYSVIEIGHRMSKGMRLPEASRAAWIAREAAAEAALVAALDADQRAAELHAMEVEALQAAARRHREETTRLRDLLSGLYVTRDRGDITVWRENPDYPDRPQALTERELAEALAALLPDRTDED